MKWEEFLTKYGDLPLIEPRLVRAGAENPESVHSQLRRWSSKGKLVKLARGKYVIAEPYRKREVPVEYLANKLVYPSYISLDYALAYHRLIPEAVYTVTSVTRGRPSRFENPLGTFRYRHVQRSMFFGYQEETLSGLNFLVATPEKAFLDRFYFWTGPVTPERLRELRPQNLDKIDPEVLTEFAQRTSSKKLIRGAEDLADFREDFLEEYDF